LLKRIGLPLAIAVCTLLTGLRAADFAALQPQGYVNDFAEVVDQPTRDQLNAYCARLEQVTGAQIALVTLKSTEGEPVEDVANLLYRKWGIGQKKTNEGALVLFVIEDHRTRIEVGYGLEPIMTDGYVGGLLRSIRPSLRSGNYGQALADTATQIGEKIAAAKGVSISTPAPLHRRRPQAEGLPIGPLVLAGIVFLLFLISRGRSGSAYGGGVSGFLTGMLIGNILGGGGGRYRGGGGGGGFDGPDSGDSFGGFGGGDSGGGGASSDW
jgi:uncharacterized protein